MGAIVVVMVYYVSICSTLNWMPLRFASRRRTCKVSTLESYARNGSSTSHAFMHTSTYYDKYISIKLSSSQMGKCKIWRVSFCTDDAMWCWFCPVPVGPGLRWLWLHASWWKGEVKKVQGTFCIPFFSEFLSQSHNKVGSWLLVGSKYMYNELRRWELWETMRTDLMLVTTALKQRLRWGRGQNG